MFTARGECFFKIAEVADMFRVKKQVVDIWRDKGLIKTCRIRIGLGEEDVFYHLGGLVRAVEICELRDFIKYALEDDNTIPDLFVWDELDSGVREKRTLSWDSDIVDFCLAAEQGAKERMHRDEAVDESKTSEPYITPYELSFIFGMKYQTICKWLRSGVIKSYVIKENGAHGARAVFYDDFKAFIFGNVGRWYDKDDGLVSERTNRYKDRRIYHTIIQNPNKKRFLDLYLNEHRRITFEREGL